MNTNTYILPEHKKPIRICKPLSGQCIMRIFLFRNFHCKIIHQNSAFSASREGHSSIGSVRGRGL